MTKQGFKATLEDILGVPRGALLDTDNRQTIGTWSSLADVQIAIVLAAELGLDDDDAETLTYDSVGDLMSMLDRRAAFQA